MEQTSLKKQGLSISHSDEKKAYVKMGGLILVYVFLCYGISPMIVTPIVASIWPDFVNSSLFGMPFTYIQYVCLYLPIFYLLSKRITDHLPTKPRENLSAKALLGAWLVNPAVMWIVSLVGLAISALFGNNGSADMNDILAANNSPVLLFICGVFGAPIIEEIVFRWIPYRKLGGYGEKNYVIWTSIIFGLFHANLVQSAYATFIGVVLALVMYRTGKVRYTIMIHMLLNFCGGIGLGSLVMGYMGEAALMIYSIFSLVLNIIGLVILILFLVKKSWRSNIWMEAKSKLHKADFLNVPFIVFTFIMCTLIVAGFFV